MKRTDEQLAIAEASRTSSSLVVNALAGSGKTTTAIDCIKANHDKRILCLSFNKSVAQTMKNKLSRMNLYNADVMTLHGFAFRENGTIYQKAGRQLKNLTPYDIDELTKNIFMHSEGFGSKAITDPYVLNRCRRLVINRFDTWCQSSALTLKEFFKNKWNTFFQESIDNYGISKRSIDKAMERVWDAVLNDPSMKFPHGVYLKLFQMDVPSYDYDLIIVDEAQDIAPVNEAIVKKMHNDGSRILLLGDRYQQIYTWNGSVNAIQRFEQYSEVMSLTQSFRCPAEVVNEATKYLTLLGFEGTFKPAPAPCVLDYKTPIIISRTNNGLLGNIIASQLNMSDIYLIGGIQSYDFDNLFDYLNFVDGKKDKIKSPAIASLNTEEEYVEYAEATQDLEMKNAKTIVQNIGKKNTWDILINAYKNGFADNLREATLCLSTGHKCKGSEFNRVQIDNSFSHIFEMQTNNTPDENGTSTIVAEELRLAYVSLTRSTNKLFPGKLKITDDELETMMTSFANEETSLVDVNEYGNLEPVNPFPQKDKKTLKHQ